MNRLFLFTKSLSVGCRSAKKSFLENEYFFSSTVPPGLYSGEVQTHASPDGMDAQKKRIEWKEESIKQVISTPPLHFAHPRPVRFEFIQKEPLDTKTLESISVGIGTHHVPEDLSDAIAFNTVKFLRCFADLFFKKRYVHRAIVLETVAAVPGMVAAMVRHLSSLRKMRHDGGWIQQLLLEAENERMHLMTWMRVTKPSLFERMLVSFVQGLFFNGFFLFYLFSPRTAHRMVGYLEEEAVISYTQFLKEIDDGHITNGPAPSIAIEYWNLRADATLRDVVLAVRADEANHRDVNHHFSDRILTKNENLRSTHAQKSSSDQSETH